MVKFPNPKTLEYRPGQIARPAQSQRPPRKVRGRFLRGPVPLNWLAEAAKLPGKTLHVGVLLWFRAGLTRNVTVHLTGTVARTFGLDRYAKSRALRQLERKGLITVDRRVGRNPVVTILTSQNDK